MTRAEGFWDKMKLRRPSLGGLDSALFFCLGLFPALYVKSLQLMALIALIGVFTHARVLFTQRARRINWAYVAIAQFVIFFFINAYAFAPLPETPPHLRTVALEAWSTSLIGFFLFGFYLADSRDLRPTCQRFMPLGMLGAFAFLTYEYLFIWDGGGYRSHGLAPTELAPPLWFLILTMISFSGYAQMGKRARAVPLILFLCTALMCMYAGARLVMLAWLLSAAFLIFYIVLIGARETRTRTALWLIGGFSVAILGVYLIDSASAGIINERVRETLHGLSNQSTTFFRLELWRAATSVIQETLPWGAGQINERPLVTAAIDKDYLAAREINPNVRLRAHQTYISYVIGGGWLALLSGLIFQSAPLAALRRNTFSILPAVVGLFGIATLNGLTDSVFQSYAAVQIYMLLTLLILHLYPRNSEYR